MKGQKSFSLTVMIIIMALLAIFVGYLLGNWLLGLVTGNGGATETEPEQQPPIEQEEIVEPPLEEGGETEEILDFGEDDLLEEDEQDTEEITETGYAVQVGAFDDYGNARALTERLENDGFQPVIVSEDPYRVHLGGAESREEAETVLEELVRQGYDAFIAH